MSFSAGRNLQNNINTTEAQTLQNKTLDNTNVVDGAPVNNSTITGASIESPSRLEMKQYADLATAQADIANRNGGELIYVDDIKKTFQVNDDGLGTKTLAEISGGQGGVNYIENSDFEQGIDGYTDDTNFTIAQTELAAEVLRGTASAKLSKAAVDASNEEISVPFTVDRGDLAKKLTISFEYDASDANYADNDILIGVRQDPNGTPSIIRINGEDLKGGKGTHYAQFQTDASIDEYELFFKVNSTNASAYDIIIDDVKVGPREVAFGTIVTDWESYTPTITGSVSDPTLGTHQLNAQWRRVGDSMEVIFQLDQSSAGSAGSGTYLIPIPPNYNIDTDKLKDYTATAAKTVGHGILFNGTNRSMVSAQLAGGSTDKVFLTGTFLGGQGDWGSTYFPLSNATSEISFQIKVPIQGWSSNAATSEDLGGREVVVEGRGNGGTSITANVTNIDFTETRDTTASWDGTTFTAPETGEYLVAGAMFKTAGVSGTVNFYVNGSIYKRASVFLNDSVHPINGVAFLEKGDELTFRFDQNATLNNNSTFHHIHIQKLASPQSILETETVAARYTSNSGQSIGTAATDIVFEDLEGDTHKAYNTSNGEYTVPVSGWYNVSAGYETNAFTPTNEVNFVNLFLLKDGTVIERARANTGSTSNTGYVSGQINDTFYFNKGEVLKFQANCNVATSMFSGSNAGTYNNFSIARIK